MKLSDLYTAQHVSANFISQENLNQHPPLGRGLFPARQKAGLDLSWIFGSKGLGVSLMPSAFDAKSTLRGRIPVSMTKTQMPFYRESMLISEKDEQEIMRAESSADPFAQSVIDHIFDDATTLIQGANIVPERMIMQLLCPKGGNMGIDIQANNIVHRYNYDDTGEWKNGHYMQLSGTSLWSSSATCDPVQDLEDAIEAQESAAGERPSVALMSGKTFGYLRKSEAIQKGLLASNPMAEVRMTEKRVRGYLLEELGLSIIVYTDKYRDEHQVTHNYFGDDIVMLMPSGGLGTTWYGITPEQRTLIMDPAANVRVVNTGVAVAVTYTNDPVNTQTTVSEIVLPSFERRNDCYALEVA